MLEGSSLKPYTTYKIGGPARFFATPKSTEELQNAVAWSQERGVPWFILGNGSNLLISDRGFPGLVIKLGGDFKKVDFDKDVVRAGGGVLLPALSRHFLAREWGGFESMCGIPGTVGGAVRMNAGTRQGEIKDNFISATVLTPAGEIKTVNRDEIGFSYRRSGLADTRDIVLTACFSKPYDEEKAGIKSKIKEIIAARRGKQPKNRKNCGSVFKSAADGTPAGWYIDQAGLKGFRIGDAMVAGEHANWIVNLGNARAEDVKGIISHIQEKVFLKFGEMLQREVLFLPEDIL